MLPPTLSSLLLVALSTAVHAVFQDEVGHLDYHHELLGLPQRETTFFHRPRKDDKASLLYTLSDVGILGAVNPSSGAVIWRQQLFAGTNITNGGGFLRAGEGESVIFSALGNSVQAWDAVGGRNAWWVEFPGRVKDLEVMEVTLGERKDVLLLSSEEENGQTALRRLDSTQGSVVWEFRETTRDIPLQVSTDTDKVFVASLHGSPSAYNIKVTVLDPVTGKRLDELIVGTKGEVHGEADVTFVGANSVAPIVAWTDAERTKLRINVLGSRTRQEFPLIADTVSVEVHAPHLIQSQADFLVHSRTKTGNRADVYSIDLRSNSVSKAYDLPHLPGHGAFATSSIATNVFITRVTEDELILTSSKSSSVLASWPIKAGNYTAHAVHAVSEVVRKEGDSYAVRSALVTDAEDWILVRNGELAWTRPEGLTGAVAASFAEIPESEEFAKTLEQEAHSNPLSAYIHRVQRHINDLQYLPNYLNSIPTRFVSSLLGKDVATKGDKLARDSFGFHKLVVLATRRGRLYGLDAAERGKILWNLKAYDIPAGDEWAVRGLSVDDVKGHANVRGAEGEYVIVKTDTGKLVESMPVGSWPAVQTVVQVDSPSGKWLLPIGLEGKVGSLPAAWAPKQTVVVRGGNGELKGVSFIPHDAEALEETAWTFNPPVGETIVHVAHRSTHDPVASIGRVLGDRTVKYKYLNPNTVVVATTNEAALTLSVYLVDTISGEILSSSTYDGIDTDKPIECAISENWFLCTYFGQYKLRDSPKQSLKGYQLVVSDLYESEEANDRGPLGDAANFSSINPIDAHSDRPILPSVVTQAYVLAAPISALTVTQTRQGITTRQLLAYLPEGHGIVGFPRFWLEPRRPVGRDPTAAEQEEGLVRYHPLLDVDPKNVITHERDVIGIQKIITVPAVLESTSLVFAYGVDVFGTRVAPSFTFDILGKGFNKLALIGTVLALAAGVTVAAPIVRRKQINARWQAPM